MVIIDRFKYLGITFTTKGSWEINTETLCGQAHKAIMSLRQRFHQYEFSPHEKYRLFNQLVEPILSYGAEVWGHVKANDMELLHRKFLKEILCVRSSTKNESVYHELGTIPLRPRRLIRMVSFWAGVAGPDSHKLSSEVYRLQRTENRANWSSKVRDALCQYGFHDTWLNGPPRKKNSFVNAFKSAVWKCEQDKIHTEIMRGEGQTRFLCHLTDVKTKYQAPEYMKVLDRKQTRVMSRFRLRTNNLAVVTGAWQGIDLPDRLCSTCNTVEDETHFLCECRRLTHLRRRYLPEYVRVSPSAESAVKLMRSTDSVVLNNICIFIKKGLKVGPHDVSVPPG